MDPDNRRPVDFEKRSTTPEGSLGQRWRIRFFALRSQSDGHSPPYGLTDGQVKLFLIHRGLRARRENRDIFDTGDYLPAVRDGKPGPARRGLLPSQRVTNAASATRLRAGRGAAIPDVAGRARRALPSGEPVWEDTSIATASGCPVTLAAMRSRTRPACTRRDFGGEVLATFPRLSWGERPHEVPRRAAILRLGRRHDYGHVRP